MLPEKYIKRMQRLLGREFDAYMKSLGSVRKTALRINSAKCKNSEEIISHLPFPCKKIPFCSDGFYFSYEKPGNLALHHAGAFYVQEPSAMAPVSSLENLLPNGIKILDACASPGGKTSQAACFSPEKNIVVSNEIVPSRCKTLVGNIERQGFRNSIVLNSDTAFLAQNFKEEFALVICDAPCSGEGMFRKNKDAVTEWSEENVIICARRQREILENLSKCVSSGGYLLYSTCTFSAEENEANVGFFLESHPDFSLCYPGDKFSGITCPGIAEYCKGFNPDYARRFYPHCGCGEGQFFALLKKSGVLVPSTEFAFSDCSRALKKDEEKAVCDFLRKTVGKIYSSIRVYGENILILPENMKVPPKHVFSCGVKLGEYKSGRIVPHHQFFSAYGNDFINKVNLSHDSEECKKYLRGEGFEQSGISDGWAAVLINGVPLGGAKAVGEYLKNHYPKGLRVLGN